MKLIIAVLAVLLATALADIPVAPRTWQVNLDLPPAQRWPWEQMIPIYNQTLQDAVGLISKFIPASLVPVLEDVGQGLLPYLGDFGTEIVQLSKVSGIPVGKAIVLNLIYEFEAACTSIVAQDAQGNIWHGRDLDFPLAKTLRGLVIDVEFMRQGQLHFHATSYAGYIGVLTGMRPGKYAISLNQRHDGTLLDNVLEVLFIRGVRPSAWMIRETLDSNGFTYPSAVAILHTSPIPAPCYIIVSGIQPGEGVVISRWRNGGDLWHLNAAKDRWFLPQTNDDHWKPPADARRAAVIKGMNAIGQQNINLEGIFAVLSTPPVFQVDSVTYTTLMSAKTGNFTAYARMLH